VSSGDCSSAIAAVADWKSVFHFLVNRFDARSNSAASFAAGVHGGGQVARSQEQGTARLADRCWAVCITSTHSCRCRRACSRTTGFVVPERSSATTSPRHCRSVGPTFCGAQVLESDELELSAAGRNRVGDLGGTDVCPRGDAPVPPRPQRRACTARLSKRAFDGLEPAWEWSTVRALCASERVLIFRTR